MRALFLCLFAAGLMSSCGEFSYKQGAGLRELDHAKQACRSDDEVKTVKCLEAHGWYIHQFEDPSAATADETSSAQARNDADIRTEANRPATALNAESGLLAVSETHHADVQKIHPGKIYKISSWWKIGASEKNMKMDLEQCAASLGVEHQPDMAEQRYTKALIQCMSKHGWKALGSDAGATK